MNLRHLGIFLVALALIFSLLTYLFKLQEDKHLQQAALGKGTCFINGECIYEERSFTLYLIAGAVSAVALALGLYLAVAGKRIGGHEGEGQGRPLPKEVDLSQLSDEELRIHHYLQEHKGSAFQSDLVRELGLTKVKVTRLLDKLEGFGLLERKRRGMTNVVVLR